MRTDRPILVVEDTEAIRDLIAESLAEEGYAVECAANGAEALAIVERHLPALVLLDLHMPVLDGWGFARALRERELDLPIVVLTAGTDAPRHARAMGAAGYVGKPFALDALLGTVERLCGETARRVSG
jgi:CheY-like chemotaxis protein